MLAQAKIWNTHNTANAFMGKNFCGAWEKRYQIVLILQTKEKYSLNKHQSGRKKNSLLGSEVCESWDVEEISAGELPQPPPIPHKSVSSMRPSWLNLYLEVNKE